MKKIIISILALAVFMTPLFSLDLEALLSRNENQPRPPATEGEMRMIIVNKAGQERVREITTYTQTTAEGTENQTLVFTSPADVRNTRFLTVNYKDPARDDEQFIFIPALRKVRTIGTSGGESKTGAFLGSDFTYADIGTLDRDDFQTRLLGEEILEGENYARVEFTARNQTVRENYGYSKIVKWINTDTASSKKSEYYDLEGRLVKRLVVYGQHLMEGKYWQFERMEMSNLESGGKTVWAFTRTDIVPSISDNYFTLRFLERGR
jgi:hypothetical protein